MIDFTLEGTIVRKPQVTSTKYGNITVITVVHNNRKKDADGKWVNAGRGLFVDFVCWRKLGEHVAELKQGDLVTVEADNLSPDMTDGMLTLRANARNVSLSLRFDAATSHRIPRETAAYNESDSVITPEGEEFTGEQLAEYAAERALANA